MPENMHNLHFGLSENMHGGAWLVIFDYSVANISPWGDLKYPRFYAIMVTVKIHLGWSFRLVWGGKYDMRFEVWPQFWPFTGSDYVGIMDFAAQKSTVFGQKSTEKHSKRGKRPLLLSLGPRFEGVRFSPLRPKSPVWPRFWGQIGVILISHRRLCTVVP